VCTISGVSETVCLLLLFSCSKLKVTISSKTLVPIQQTIRRHITHDDNLTLSKPSIFFCNIYGDTTFHVSEVRALLPIPAQNLERLLNPVKKKLWKLDGVLWNNINTDFHENHLPFTLCAQCREHAENERILEKLLTVMWVQKYKRATRKWKQLHNV
jgi:hypothetical protein